MNFTCLLPALSPWLPKRWSSKPIGRFALEKESKREEFVLRFALSALQHGVFDLLVCCVSEHKRVSHLHNSLTSFRIGLIFSDALIVCAVAAPAILGDWRYVLTSCYQTFLLVLFDHHRVLLFWWSLNCCISSLESVLFQCGEVEILWDSSLPQCCLRSHGASGNSSILSSCLVLSVWTFFNLPHYSEVHFGSDKCTDQAMAINCRRWMGRANHLAARSSVHFDLVLFVNLITCRKLQ